MLKNKFIFLICIFLSNQVFSMNRDFVVSALDESGLGDAGIFSDLPELEAENSASSGNQYDFDNEAELKQRAEFECESCGARYSSIQDVNNCKISARCAGNSNLLLVQVAAAAATAKSDIPPKLNPKKRKIDPLNKENNQHPRKNYCTECEKKFGQTSAYKEHMNIHNGVKSFECIHCYRKFTQQGNCNVHQKICLKKKQEFEKAFYCDKCKKYDQTSTYENHMKIHYLVKIWSCDKCQKQFDKKSTYMDHMNIHNKVKPFKCDHCSKTFTQRGNCNCHMRICKENPNREVKKQKRSKKEQSSSDQHGFVCQYCNNLVAKTMEGLQKHIKENHPGI